MKFAEPVAAQRNFFRPPRVGPRFRFDNLVQDQRLALRISRIEIDFLNCAIKIPGATARFLRIGINVQQGLHAIATSRKLRKFVGKAVGSIVDTAILAGEKFADIKAKKWLSGIPIGPEAARDELDSGQRQAARKRTSVR